jgi:hypothetical protein
MLSVFMKSRIAAEESARLSVFRHKATQGQISRERAAASAPFGGFFSSLALIVPRLVAVGY